MPVRLSCCGIRWCERVCVCARARECFLPICRCHCSFDFVMFSLSLSNYLSPLLSHRLITFRIDMADVCISHASKRARQRFRCNELHWTERQLRSYWLGDHLKLPIIRNECIFIYVKFIFAHKSNMRERPTQWIKANPPNRREEKSTHIALLFACNC